MNSVGKNTIIAIAGASASGKSLFASTVYQELVAEIGGERIAILSEDAYYRDQSHPSFEQRTLTNYDHPAAFEHELLAAHVQALRSGKAIQMPQYSYKIHTRTEETITVQPAKVILVEGILLLTDEKLREQMSEKAVKCIQSISREKITETWEEIFDNVTRHSLK